MTVLGATRCRWCNVGPDPRCHRCVELDGDVLPGCMGTAVGANHAQDLTACTCEQHAGTVAFDRAFESPYGNTKDQS